MFEKLEIPLLDRRLWSIPAVGVRLVIGPPIMQACASCGESGEVLVGVHLRTGDPLAVKSLAIGPDRKWEEISTGLCIFTIARYVLHRSHLIHQQLCNHGQHSLRWRLRAKRDLQELNGAFRYGACHYGVGTRRLRAWGWTHSKSATASYSYPWFISAIHTRSIHISDSYGGFILFIHTSYSYPSFIPLIHIIYSYRLFILVIHIEHSYHEFISVSHPHQSSLKRSIQRLKIYLSRFLDRVTIPTRNVPSKAGILVITSLRRPLSPSY